MSDQRGAWLVFRTKFGIMFDIRVFSEPNPTVTIGMRNYLIASTTDKSFESARAKMGRWWSNKKPWQKRALMNNAMIEAWEPIKV